MLLEHICYIYAPGALCIQICSWSIFDLEYYSRLLEQLLLEHNLGPKSHKSTSEGGSQRVVVRSEQELGSSCTSSPSKPNLTRLGLHPRAPCILSFFSLFFFFFLVVNICIELSLYSAAEVLDFSYFKSRGLYQNSFSQMRL